MQQLTQDRKRFDPYLRHTESIPVAAYYAALDDRPLAINTMLLEILGFSDETAGLEALDKGLSQLYTNPNQRATFLDKLLKNDRIYGYTSEIIHPITKQSLWIVEDAWLVYDPYLEPVGFQATVSLIGLNGHGYSQREYYGRLRQNLHGLIEQVFKQEIDSSLYQRLLDLVVHNTQGAQAGSVLVRNPSGRFGYAAAIGFDLEGLQAVEFETDELLAYSSDETTITIYHMNQSSVRDARQDLLRKYGRIDAIKSSISSTIMVNGELVAVLHLNNFDSTHAFDAEAIEVVRFFSRLAGTLLRQRMLELDLKEWVAFHEAHQQFVLETLQRGLDESFYTRILEHAQKVISGVDAGSILLRNADGDFEFVATVGFDIQELKKIRLKREQLFLDTEQINAGPASLQEHNTRHTDAKTLEILNRAGRISEVKQFMLLPIYVENELIAALSLDSFSKAEPFNPETHAMASSFAAQAGILLMRLSMQEELARKNQQLVQMASYDGLTGLPNRTLFREHLEQSLHGARRSGQKLGLLFLDLDGFKLVNDSLGHNAGDELLKQVALRLKRCVRAADTVARQSGDEFVILLDNIKQPEDPATVSRRILDAFKQPVQIGPNSVQVGASIGITVFPDDALSAEDLLRNADTAMYVAKYSGKNRFHFFTNEMNSKVADRMELEQAMRRGLELEEFSLHYQPRVDLRTGKAVSMEALARWIHPSRGFVSPGEFIPLAEQTGLILPLGRYVLEKACKQAKLWNDQGRNLKVAVNLSVRQLQQSTIVDEVREVLEKTGLNPHLLELEITESAAMTNVEENIIKLNKLRELGVSIAIDDFGTAYSSLNYLKRLPVNSLKIDRSFVIDIDGDPKAMDTNAAIIRAVTGIAKSLGYSVVAEGIESESQLRFLQELECEEGQGYLFSRPLPAENLEELLEMNFFPK